MIIMPIITNNVIDLVVGQDFLKKKKKLHIQVKQKWLKKLKK